MWPFSEPLLAHTIKDVASLPLPLYASVKLDGVRAFVWGGVVYSRKLIAIPNAKVQALFGHAKYDGLDGELIVGDPTAPGCFNRTQSLTSSLDGDDDVRFHVFDNFAYRGAYAERLKAVPKRGRGVERVEQQLLTAHAAIDDFIEVALDAGYEGAIFRAPDSLYRSGRSTLRQAALLRYKPFEDAEAVVLAVNEANHNMNAATIDARGKTKRSSAKAGKVAAGYAGSVLCRGVGGRWDGVEFEVFGFTRALAEAMLRHPDQVIGKVITYRYATRGCKNAPRHATWKGFRNSFDGPAVK